MSAITCDDCGRVITVGDYYTFIIGLPDAKGHRFFKRLCRECADAGERESEEAS